MVTGKGKINHSDSRVEEHVGTLARCFRKEVLYQFPSWYFRASSLLCDDYRRPSRLYDRDVPDPLSVSTRYQNLAMMSLSHGTQVGMQRPRPIGDLSNTRHVLAWQALAKQRPEPAPENCGTSISAISRSPPLLSNYTRQSFIRRTAARAVASCI